MKMVMREVQDLGQGCGSWSVHARLERLSDRCQVFRGRRPAASRLRSDGVEPTTIQPDDPATTQAELLCFYACHGHIPISSANLTHIRIRGLSAVASCYPGQRTLAARAPPPPPQRPD